MIVALKICVAVLTLCFEFAIVYAISWGWLGLWLFVIWGLLFRGLRRFWLVCVLFCW